MSESSESRATRFLRLHRSLAKLLLLTVGILLALFVAELALRVFGFSYFNPYIADQELGYSLRPNAEGWWRREGNTYIRINSNGFRDRERNISKPPGTFRVAVLGDSYAEAFQVPLEKTFYAIMEEQLVQCPRFSANKVEVLNFGVSGFSTGRELILLRNRVWQYSPDAVVLLVTPGNDIRDNSRALNQYSQQPLPYFVWQDGKLTLDDSLVVARNNSLSFRLQRSNIGRAFRWVQSHLRLLGLFYTIRETYQSQGRPPGKVKDQQAGSELGLDNEVYLPPLNREWSEAWELTEKLILQMRNEVQAHGAQFLLVVGASAIQDNPDPATRENFMRLLGVKDLSYPNERITKFAGSQGISVLDLGRALADHSNRKQQFLHGSGSTVGRGHWNEAGHQLAGELITGELCRASP